MDERLISCIDSNNIFPSQQSGFRRKRNNTQTICQNSLLSSINLLFQNCFAHCQDCFQFTSARIHNLKIVKVIESFLKDRSFKAFWAGFVVCAINVGCPQGSCLSFKSHSRWMPSTNTGRNCFLSVPTLSYRNVINELQRIYNIYSSLFAALLPLCLSKGK